MGIKENSFLMRKNWKANRRCNAMRFIGWIQRLDKIYVRVKRY